MFVHVNINFHKRLLDENQFNGTALKQTNEKSSPNDSSYNIAALVMFIYSTIDRITSGIISAGGIICSK